MPTYGNIGGASKEIKPWYTNINGAQNTISNIYTNINGTQKSIYTSTHRWAKYTYSKTEDFRYAILDHGESDDISMGSDAFPNDAYLSRSYNFNQSTGDFTLTGTTTNIHYGATLQITVGNTSYGHNNVDLTGYYMIINGSMSGRTMYELGWVATEWVPAYDEYGSWHIEHIYMPESEVKWTPIITYVESENINAYENYGNLSSEYWKPSYFNYLFYDTNTHYKLLY